VVEFRLRAEGQSVEKAWAEAAGQVIDMVKAIDK
jgi:hypothetical protein